MPQTCQKRAPPSTLKPEDLDLRCIRKNSTIRTMTTTLGYLVLGFVRLSPASGFDLRRVFATTPLGNFSGSPGAIYPLLRRMERRRLLKATLDKTNTRRPRRVYRITALGEATLKKWVMATVDPATARRYGDLFGIRIAFMEGGLLSPAERRRVLAGFEQAVAAEADHLQGVIAHLQDAPEGIRSLLIQAEELYRFRLRWIKGEKSRSNARTRRKQ
jgi:DNA-binding PadR family transcriptional regulator